MNFLTAKISARLVSLTLFAAACVGQAHAAHDSNNLTVDETAGPAKVRMSERWHTPAIGMAMVMPTIASTGAAGNIRMSQLESVITVAANTTIEVLEGPVPGLPMQRVVQDRGSAFYDIAPRGDNKLRVEASYLVAVVKGTQFNVTVDADTTTIALFEGSLQIEAPNVGDVVDIFAGQIATFHRDDQSISIIDMTSGELLARNSGTSTSGTGGSSTAGSASAGIDLGTTSLGTSLVANLGPSGVEIDLGVDVGQIDVGVDLDLDLGLLGDVGETLTGGIDDLLGDNETGTGALDENIGDLLPELGELLPDPGGLLGL